MTCRRILALGFLLIVCHWLAAADAPSTKNKASDTELVKRIQAARREYHTALVAIYQHYDKTGDRERAKWAEEELKAYHLINKPSFRVEVDDVPGPTLQATANDPNANDLYKEAMKYKDKGTGTDYILNQRRAEILLYEILIKYPSSDKIADVAYQLGDIYESRAFKHYERAALYFERVAQWKKGGRTDARLRAAYIYDKMLNERTKAIEMYRDEIEHDTDAERIKFAEKRLAELTAPKR